MAIATPPPVSATSPHAIDLAENREKFNVLMQKLGIPQPDAGIAFADEEAWERLGHVESVFEARWPAWDEGLVVEDRIEVVVQVNGKTRSKVSVARDADEETVVAAALRESVG